MALPLREAFTARALGVLWNDYKAKLGTGPYSGRMKFGTVKQDSLDLKFIKGKNGLPVSLKASNFDAQAPLRDVGGFSDIQNEMPFYRESYMVTDSGAAHKKDHFVEISGDEDKWNASATATPLDDLIQARRDFAKKTGYSLTRFSMNTETFEMILKAEDTKKQVLGITAYNGGIRVRQADVLSYLREYGIEIEVYDKVYIDEEGNTKYFIPTNIVSAQSAGVYLGDYTFGRTPEERSGSLTDGNLSLVETGISVYSYTTNHPINTHCVVSMIGLPTFEGMDSVVVMKVA